MEATKEEYPSTTRNQDIVEDPEADITKVSSNIDLTAMSYKARAGKRGYTKLLIDSGVIGTCSAIGNCFKTLWKH